MNNILFLVIVAPFAASACDAAYAAVRRPIAASFHHAKVHKAGSRAATVLWSSSGFGTGSAVVSQNFEAKKDAYDANAADDFQIPSGETWKIKIVSVEGVYFNGSGPAVSETVTFYKNAGGLPGAVIKAYSGVEGTDRAGSFKIRLVPALNLTKGRYWVSVQANMDFSAGGEWGWANDFPQALSPAAWENPGDGFATGCTTYAVESSCIAGSGPDHFFQLRGSKL